MYCIDSRAKHLLIVDDNAELCETLKYFFRRRNYSVDSCLTEGEALKLTSEEHFDLIIANVRLPVASGMDLLSTINKRRTAKKVILTTPFTPTDHRVYALLD